MALCFSAYSNAQEISTTGELITNTQQAWSGCSTATSGAFWGGNSGGPCPGIDSNGIIIFSYGETTLSQTTSLATALSNSGSGLQINGYNYSWWVKNSNINGTQPGGYDSTAYVGVTLYNRDGTVAESDLYNYGYYISDWTRFSGVRNYTSPYSLSQVDNITLSITSRDDGYWAGYYGPEFRNFSLTANYSVDPCVADPLYSSSCPGYLEAYMTQLALLLGWNTSESEVDLIDYSLSTMVSQPVRQEETTTGEVKVDAGGIEVSTTGELSVPDGIPEEVKENKPVDMNLISRIVREATDETATMSIVNQSIQDSMAEDANPNFSMTNETLASISRQTENSIQHSILENQELNQSLSVNSNNFMLSEQNVSNEETNLTENITQTQSNQPVTQITNEDTKETTQTVKKNIQDNEAAGEVSIDSLAQTPIDFNAYLNQQLKDMAFYAPKEIYKGQKNVDNARLLRGLTGGSDRLHQQMIDQQYR